MSPSEVLLETRVEGSTVTVVRYAPFQELRRHAHGEEGLTVVLHGTFLEEAQHRTMVAGVGAVATRPYGLSHTNRFGPHGAVILAVIPDGDRFGDPIREWRWQERPTAFRAALRLIARAEDALPELLSALGSAPRRDITLARRIRELLDDAEERPSISALARRLHVHPVHLARQFRRAYGMSPREYRTMQMVKRAAEAIVGTRAALSRIAHEQGFADQSHMCRAFRGVTGWSPSRLRSNSRPRGEAIP